MFISRSAFKREYSVGQSVESHALVSKAGSLLHVAQTALIVCKRFSAQLLRVSAFKNVLRESAPHLTHSLDSVNDQRHD